MNKYSILSVAIGSLMLTTSCNDYLDRLPDDRATVDNVEKAAQLLVSAYPTATTILPMEMSSDNVEDNGRQYSSSNLVEEYYRFQNSTQQSFDSPYFIWALHYEAIATANTALDALNKFPQNSESNAVRAEALLCRAFGMFNLSNMFCMTYNPDKADKYPGLFYPKTPDIKIDEVHSRGTLAELYKNIEEDIETALPMLNDGHLKVPKYHFNTRAAYAFAARFNLYYQKWDKVITYATRALGNNPASLLRDFAPYKGLTINDYYYRYVKATENPNFMILAGRSQTGRLFQGEYPRFNHNMSICGYETFWAFTPWSRQAGVSSNNVLWQAHKLYGSERCVYNPKQLETFAEGKVLGTGQPMIMDTYFTADETLLCRAEAYALSGKTDEAIQDMNLWQNAFCDTKFDNKTRTTLTLENINDFVSKLPYAPVNPKSDNERSIRKTLHPQGKALEELVGKANVENILQIILQMRRMSTITQGIRFMDLKRYGIEYTHHVDNEAPITFKAGDLRGALQVPDRLLNIGVQANPREK